MGQSINNKLIAKNTLMLYFRMLFTIAIQLYTVPIILRALGVDDYGLYIVIGSVMAMVSLVGFISSGCQRFFAYSIGKGDTDQLKKLFNSTQTIYIILSFAVFLILEIIGIWFVNNKMQIPNGRLVAAHWVFQLSAVSFIVGLFTIPYNALIIAHERMSIYAYISILSSVLKLLAALAISNLSYDRLIFYAFFILVIQLIERVYNQVYCLKHFDECRHWKFEIDMKQSKEMLVFSGYNIVGAIALTLRNQGMNVIMNVFFGTIMNAAHGIASQIQAVINQLINNIYQASRPQITKSYALNDIEGMWKLVFRTSLLSYYLVLVISVVVFFEIPTILPLWLHEVPQYTVNICRILIVCLLLETTSNQLIGVFQAMNKIRDVQVSSCLILLLNLPIAYFMLKHDSSVVMMPYYVQVVISIFYVISVVVVSNKKCQLDIKYFFFHVLVREAVVTTIVLLSVYYLRQMLTPSIYRVIFTTVCCLLVSGILIVYIGFEKVDLMYLRNKLKTFIK